MPMQTAQPVQNPFALLLNPAAVLAEVERSGRLNRLASRICRPLDKPVLGTAGDDEKAAGESSDLAVADDWSTATLDTSDIIR
jgi:hypothetical protein